MQAGQCPPWVHALNINVFLCALYVLRGLMLFYLEQALLVGFTKSHLIPERQLNDCYEIFFMQISNRQYGTVLESVRSGVGLYILIFALFFYITFHLLH